MAKTKHNPKAKLSQAMVIGRQIAKENGIKQGTGQLFERDYDGNIECACAMGMAIIGKIGLNEVKKNRYGFSLTARAEDYFPELANPTTECLLKTPKGARGKAFTKHRPSTVSAFIWNLNDLAKIPVTKIAEYLKSCKL